ncbi:MAG: NAD-dependent epimerase/dehydratase family protein, partial [Bacteroidota bacterium]|nr:NAD-dependent epimerase/dehydratase family protein [Bacteroidota bacterium]
MANRRNLVLGGSGTIGTELCKSLIKQGEEVINLDLKNGFDLRFMDLMPYKNVDYLWFLAWEVGGAKYIYNNNNLYDIINNNSLICHNIFSFLKKTKIPFLFTSSQLASSDNTYGITKLLGEEWTKILGGKTVRFWNVYGWEEPSEKS